MPKRVDMTPEQYEAVCERLKKARAIAEQKLRRQNQTITDAPEPVQEPEPTQEVEIEEQEPVIESLPMPVKMNLPKSKKVAIPKPQTAAEPVDLDAYFDAKYRAKSRYMPQPQMVQEVAQPPPQQQPSSSHLIHQTAREQIKGRVNNELYQLAMRSVFPNV